MTYPIELLLHWNDSLHDDILMCDSDGRVVFIPLIWYKIRVLLARATA